jgi:hypothetical protein
MYFIIIVIMYFCIIIVIVCSCPQGVKGLGLLTAKPIIYAANVFDSDLAAGNDMVYILFMTFKT